LLDASGPASVFHAANRTLSRRGKPPFYIVETVSADGGLVSSHSGVALQTRALSRTLPAKVDTLLITGAEGDSVRAAIAQPAIRRWVPRCAKAAARFGSVCSGAFILAALGLLDRKRVATHWDACKQIAELFPAINVDTEKLYVVDGNVWTSAGGKHRDRHGAAMVSSDVDAALAGEVAKRLVLYARRAGYQSQFSPLLRVQEEADRPFVELINWAHANLDGVLDVPALAARAGLGERNLYRKFLAATGETPARFIESLRLDAARLLLMQKLPLKVVAARVGLSPSARFTQAFERRFGVTPGLFRDMHACA
jgi:transcriptional regulator GlxA family with amidase domain